MAIKYCTLCAFLLAPLCFGQGRFIKNENGAEILRAIVMDDFRTHETGGKSKYSFAQYRGSGHVDAVRDIYQEIDEWLEHGERPAFAQSLGQSAQANDSSVLCLYVMYWAGKHFDTTDVSILGDHARLDVSLITKELFGYVARAQKQDPEFIAEYDRAEEFLNLPSRNSPAFVGFTTTHPVVTPPAMPAPAPDVHVYRAIDLIVRYRQNEVAVESELKGQQITIDGIVADVAEDIFDQPYVVVGSQLWGIHAEFAKSSEPDLVSLRRGRSVAITGTVTGFLLGSMRLEDCNIGFPSR